MCKQHWSVTNLCWSGTISFSKCIYLVHILIFLSFYRFQENPCRIIETYIYDREKNLPDFYGKRLRLVLTGYIRPELKYSNLQDLIVQIEHDVEIAKLFNEKLLRGDFPSIDADRVRTMRQISSSPIDTAAMQSDYILSKSYDW